MKNRASSTDIKSVIIQLQKRRKLMFWILLVAIIVVFTVDGLFEVTQSKSLEIQTQHYLVYGLITYKMIELFIIYTLFYSKHLKRYLQNPDNYDLLLKFEKNGKRFFMLVAQGNIVFGVISFKLLANPFIFLLFMLFAVTTLLLVKPSTINTSMENHTAND